ncbi:hypothetical protein EC988_003916 [Linderina pennispora]|nr:hypothetical protein EC988_003916 [Linderina pennispora]
MSALLFKELGTAAPVSRLDTASIELIRRRLANASQRQRPLVNFKYRTDEAEVKEAAVLLALCSVNRQLCVLFEERNNKLSSHSGEVCFAGGKVDPTDRSYEDAALRETYEELGIAREDVQIIGSLPPVPNVSYTIRVHPVVGVVAGELDPRTLRVNRSEVHRAFALPLAHFFEPANREAQSFRSMGVHIPSYASDKKGLRIWGMTAFVLYEFLLRICQAKNDVPGLEAPRL